LTNGDNVNIVKSAKFGNRIVIGFTRTNLTFEDPSVQPYYLPFYEGPDADNTMYMMMITSTGAIVTPPFEVDTFSISADDDWRVLQNGTVAWTYVNSDGVLSLYWLTAREDTTPPSGYKPSTPCIVRCMGSSTTVGTWVLVGILFGWLSIYKL